MSEIEKRCTACGEVKHAALFYKGKAKCRVCCLAYAKMMYAPRKAAAEEARRKREVERPNKRRREWSKTNRKRLYGLSEADYQRLLSDSGGICGICHEPLNGRPNIDHDHSTGRVRGILCGNCNFGLGHFRDRISLLYLAAEYLEGYESAPSK